MADIKFNRITTALARVAQNNPIETKFNEANMFYPTSYYFHGLGLIRQSLEIVSRQSHICNDSPSFTVPKIWF